MNEDVLRLLALCAIRVNGSSLDWSMLAHVARSGGLDDLYDGHIPATQSASVRAKMAPLLRAGLSTLGDARARVDQELDAAEAVSARLFTVMDPGYPTNLAKVHDLPPFIFVRGAIYAQDSRSVAVVGTRQATEDGLRRATRLSRELTEGGVTVVSGMARGIDTAAHRAAIAAHGRTLAVLGTGVTRCYPAENKGLAEEIVEHGALVSQFWPTRPPGRDTFPRRNRVTSGISQGSVVIEASSTSGAKMQARLASEHGKRVWLVASLVDQQLWARKMIDQNKASVIKSTQDVLEGLDREGSASAGMPAPVQGLLELA